MKQPHKDYLSTLTITGRIMIFVPLIVDLILFVSSALWGDEAIAESSIEGPSVIILQRNAGMEYLTTGMSVLFICGLCILIYVAIQRFRQGLRGEI